MSIESLLVAMVFIAILCVVAALFLKLVPMPSPVGQIVWAVVTIICLLILLGAFTGRHIITFN